MGLKLKTHDSRLKTESLNNTKSFKRLHESTVKRETIVNKKEGCSNKREPSFFNTLSLIDELHSYSLLQIRQACDKSILSLMPTYRINGTFV
jgi:hypothetical protein